MNEQMVEQILALVSQGGESAYWLALVWMILDFMEGPMVVGIFVGGIYLLLRFVKSTGAFD